MDSAIAKMKKGLKDIVLLDFGIGTKYVDNLGLHITKKKMSKFRGSHEFAAIDILQLYRMFDYAWTLC